MPRDPLIANINEKKSSTGQRKSLLRQSSTARSWNSKYQDTYYRDPLTSRTYKLKVPPKNIISFLDILDQKNKAVSKLKELESKQKAAVIIQKLIKRYILNKTIKSFIDDNFVVKRQKNPDRCINNGSIILPRDKVVLNKVYDYILEESDESNIKDFLAIKDRLSNEQLVDFIDMVLPNIGDDNHYIRVLILGVKDRLKNRNSVKDRLKESEWNWKEKIAPDLIEEIFKYTESSKIEIIKQYASILNISW